MIFEVYLYKYMYIHLKNSAIIQLLFYTVVKGKTSAISIFHIAVVRVSDQTKY